ncbi:hypothetical protein MPSI1_000001 [Malassezia psittaci]|uniref:Uncharacterized protein n=1 Tax=Malassezia psittaci TaxID=1821823 RepID=A0AAF0F5U6_9BASI|nr:hypothetical protein MPSI1_000001 [Malassezia psittaci]
MFAIQLLSLVFIAIVASAHGSPIEQRSGKCQPVGKPTKFVTHMLKDESTGYFETVKKSQDLVLVRANSTTEEFQFYECSPSSNKYRKSDYRAKYGQLRSTKHEGKCVTAGNYWIQTGGDRGGEGTFAKYPSNDGTITLKACAKGDTEMMRRQWLGVGVIQDKDTCEAKSVFQASQKGDVNLEALIGDSEKSHFGYIDATKENERPRGYLSKTFPKGC